MASNPNPSYVPEIGPDGIAKESPIIAYTEKIIEEEQLQLKRYIQENYSKIRDVEKELENLTFELKLTAGPKRAALEHMRKKIEVVNERIRAAKLKEEQTKKAWEAAAQIVKDEEALKQKLCDDLNQLVQESAHTQHSRLEELKRRLEALNPSRVSCDVLPSHNYATDTPKAIQPATNYSSRQEVSLTSGIFDGNNQQIEAQMTEKKRIMNPPKTKNIVLKSRTAESGWTGAGFDVDGRT